MKKNIVIISTSLREGSNSDLLVDEFMKGALDAGNHVDKIQLCNKTIQFCKGCLACQSLKEGRCIVHDDMDDILEKMKLADSIVFATPIYFYGMSGQMKTVLDRSNPLYPIPYKFRDIYLITSAAENDKDAMEGAIHGLQGWIDCFEHSRLAGVVYGIGADDKNTMNSHPDMLREAYVMGKNS